MSRHLIIRPDAERDLAEARDWYNAQQAGLGVEFLTAVEDRFDYIGDFPESHAVEYRGVRPAGLLRFPYVVYYRITGDGVEVLAVQGSRCGRSGSPRHRTGIWRDSPCRTNRITDKAPADKLYITVRQLSDKWVKEPGCSHTPLADS